MLTFKLKPDQKRIIKYESALRGLTLCELAEKLGINQTYLSAIINGRKAFSIKFARKLCGFFNFSLEKFVKDGELKL